MHHPCGNSAIRQRTVREATICSFAAVAIAATVAGTAVGVFGKISQGRSAAALAEAQAKAIEQQSQADQHASNFEIARNIRQFQTRQGEAIAQVGASGVALQGSPTDVLAANAGENQLDLDAIRYGSLLRASQARSQADITRWQGGQEMKASLFSAGADVLKAAGSIFDPSKSIRFGTSQFARQGSIGSQY